MEKQPIDELFRQQLYDAEIKPKIAIWETIYHRLDNRRVVPLWAYATVAASLLLIGSYTWLMMSNDNLDQVETIAGGVKLPAEVKLPVTDRLLNRDKTELISPETSANYQSVEVQYRSVKGQELIMRNIKSEKNYGQVKPNKDELQLINHQYDEGKIADKQEVIKPDELNKLTLKTIKVEAEVNVELSKGVPRYKIPSSTERTLIVSIDMPTEMQPKTTELLDKVENTTLKYSFGSLVSRVKRLKEGDIMASSTPKVAKPGHRGFSKLYETVKESIQNNAID